MCRTLALSASESYLKTHSQHTRKHTTSPLQTSVCEATRWMCSARTGQRSHHGLSHGRDSARGHESPLRPPNEPNDTTNRVSESPVHFPAQQTQPPNWPTDSMVRRRFQATATLYPEDGWKQRSCVSPACLTNLRNRANGETV